MKFSGRRERQRSPTARRYHGRDIDTASIDIPEIDAPSAIIRWKDHHSRLYKHAIGRNTHTCMVERMVY